MIEKTLTIPESILQARNITYDNSNSGLAAVDIQAAIDEIKETAGSGTGNDGVSHWSGTTPEYEAVEDTLEVGTIVTLTDDFTEDTSGAAIDDDTVSLVSTYSSSKIEELMEAKSGEIGQLEAELYGADPVYQSIGDFYIGRRDATGGFVDDSVSKLRITTDFVYFDYGTTITFAKPSKYVWIILMLDENDNYVKAYPETGYSSDSTYTLDSGYKISLVVREQNYAAWTDELIETYKNEYVNITTTTMLSEPGVLDRLDRVDSAPERLSNLESRALNLEQNVSNVNNSLAARNITSLYHVTIPEDNVMSETDVTIETIKNISNPNTACIAFLTDPHINTNEDITFVRENCKRIQYAISAYNQISSSVDVELTVWGGDYLENFPTTTKTGAMNGYTVLKELLLGSNNNNPIVVLKGNHDDNTMNTDYVNNFIDGTTLYDVLLGYEQERTCRDADHIDRFYGYYDIPNKKIRVIYLNTVDLIQTLDTENNTLDKKGQWTTGFTQEQLTYIIDKLHFDEAGWHVMFMSHHPLPLDTSAGTDVGVNPTHNGAGLIQIIEAFMNNTSGTLTNDNEWFSCDIAYDFTNNKSNTVIGCVNGHTHKYTLDTVNNVNYIGMESVYGSATGEDGIEHISTISFLVINRKERTLTVVNNGSGEDAIIPY